MDVHGRVDHVCDDNEIVNGNCVFMGDGCMVHDMRSHGEWLHAS